MKSIKSKILLSITLTVIISLLITGITSIFLNYSSTNELLQQTMEEMAGLAAQRVEHELEAYANVAYDTGCIARLSSSESSTADKQEIIDQRVKTHGFVGGNVIGSDGISIFDGNDYNDRLYVQEALKGNTYISDPLVSKVTGKLSIMIAAPLWENGVPESRVVGAVYFKPPETFLNDIVTQIHVSGNGSAYLLNSGGYTIAHKNMDNVMNQENTMEDAKTDSKLAKLAELESNMASGKSGFGRYSYGGVNKFLAYAPINGTSGWSIGINAPVSDFMDSTKQSIIITIVLLIAAAVISVIIAIRLSAGIGNPITLCSTRLNQLAEGDLDSPVPQIDKKDETGKLARSTETIVSMLSGIITDLSWGLGEMSNGNFTVSSKAGELYRGDFAQLLQAMKGIVNRLSTTLLQVKTAAEQVSAGSEQVSAGAQALSQGTTEQASSIQELAATITDISGQINETAANAANTREKTDNTESRVLTCNQQMQEMISAMNEISGKSDEIGKIIKTIEDIAFQTNILALNAAVEAARAGEAGKGFAVVADEVRNLASKSSDASKNTAALIEDTIQAVEKGTKVAYDTAQSLDSIVTETKAVTEAVDKITIAAERQAASTSQISTGIDQISSVVQTNSATAEESAAASEELSGQADMLKNLVDQFKLNDSDFNV